jgi:hypothetical protein
MRVDDHWSRFGQRLPREHGAVVAQPSDGVRHHAHAYAQRVDLDHRVLLDELVDGAQAPALPVGQDCFELGSRRLREKDIEIDTGHHAAGRPCAIAAARGHGQGDHPEQPAREAGSDLLDHGFLCGSRTAG